MIVFRFVLTALLTVALLAVAAHLLGSEVVGLAVNKLLQGAQELADLARALADADLGKKILDSFK